MAIDKFNNSPTPIQSTKKVNEIIDDISEKELELTNIKHTSATLQGGDTGEYYHLTEDEKDKLLAIAVNATKTENSVTNGNIKINDTETTVYTLHPANHPAIYDYWTANSSACRWRERRYCRWIYSGCKCSCQCEFTDTIPLTTINGRKLVQ